MAKGFGKGTLRKFVELVFPPGGFVPARDIHGVIYPIYSDEVSNMSTASSAQEDTQEADFEIVDPIQLPEGT